MLLLLALVAASAVLAASIWWQTRRPPGYPPGPGWLPLVGNVLLVERLTRDLGTKYRAFTRLAREHATPVLGLRFGADLTVIVSSLAAIREVLTRGEFEGRPTNFFMNLRSLGTRKGVSTVDGRLWQEQRAFVMRHLRALGFSGPAMQGLVDEEVAALLEELGEAQGKPLRLMPLLAPAVLNVIFHFTAGTRFPRGDKRLAELLTLMHDRTRAFDMAGGRLSAMPWVRFIQPVSSGYSIMLELNDKLRAYFTSIITDHKKTYMPEKRRDLIDAFLYEMEKLKENPNPETTFTDNQLIMLCYDMFVAGSETTSNALRFAFLMMLLHPLVQDRVYEEIKDAVGTERLPTLDDKDSLVYTRAALMESQRICHVIPIRGTRRAVQDTSLCGYKLPKDTVVLLNIWSIHMDKDYWGDPEVFRPERFIAEDGQLKEYDAFLPFGLGRRRCLGEILAKCCLFQIFAGIMQKFELVPADGCNLQYGCLDGVNIAPKPYDIIFKPRQ